MEVTREEAEPPQRRESLRPRRGSDFGHIFGPEEFLHHTFPVLIQYSLQTGLKKFGEEATKAVGKELHQIHMRDTFEPKLAESLTIEQKNKTLESIMLSEEKRDGRLKGQYCANGRKQRQ